MKKAFLRSFTILSMAIGMIGLPSVSPGQDIQPYKAEDVKPYKTQEAQPVKAGDKKPFGTPKDRLAKGIKNQPKAMQENTEKHAGGAVSSDFFGLFQYWVPGTSYTVPDYANKQLVIHTSAGSGVLPGGLKINADGTYIWNSSWDEKVIKGKWRVTGESDYPLELIQAQEGKNWKVGKTVDDSSTITLWSGSTIYTGKKIKP